MKISTLPVSAPLLSVIESKHKLLYITRAYGQQAGGMERLSWELAEALLRVIDVKVIAHRGRRILSPLFGLWCLPAALRAAKRADSILLGDPVLSLTGWLLKQVTGKPTAVIVHGLDITYPARLYQIYLRLFFAAFDQYIAISPAVDALLRDRGLGDRVSVITPGVTDRLYQPDMRREELDSVLQRATAGKTVLATVGRLVARKGQAWFITEVLPALPATVWYVVAGAGPDDAAVRAAAQKAGVAERVIILGKVSDEQVRIIYNTVDAFVQPNIHVAHDMEGFGIVLLEAALCARPIFAADIDGIPAAIIAGKNGVLLPSEDVAAWIAALQQFCAAPAQYTPKPNDARTFTAERYSWPAITAQYERLLVGGARHV